MMGGGMNKSQADFILKDYSEIAYNQEFLNGTNKIIEVEDIDCISREVYRSKITCSHTIQL